MTDAERAEIIKQIRAREAKQYNEIGVQIRQNIVPTCATCESNFSGKCAASEMWDTSDDFKAPAIITDDDSVCKYWTPSCSAYIFGLKKAGLENKRRKK